jgi:hypothetical protein
MGHLSFSTDIQWGVYWRARTVEMGDAIRYEICRMDIEIVGGCASVA